LRIANLANIHGALGDNGQSYKTIHYMLTVSAPSRSARVWKMVSDSMFMVLVCLLINTCGLMQAIYPTVMDGFKVVFGCKA
jgi:hypothetical protein